MKFSITTLLLLMSLACVIAQEDAPFQIEGYVDAYYARFSDETDDFQKFTTVSPYDNRISLNVAQIGLHYNQNNVRSNVVFHFGDIMKATWSSAFFTCARGQYRNSSYK